MTSNCNQIKNKNEKHLNFVSMLCFNEGKVTHMKTCKNLQALKKTIEGALRHSRFLEI